MRHPDQGFALLQSGPEGSRAFEAGKWVSSHAEEIAASATDPLNIVLGVLGLTGVAGVGCGVRAALPAVYYRSVRALGEGEGAITWGYREQSFFDGLAKPPIVGLWKDLLMGTQLVAPTGRGKTQALLPIIIQHLEAGRSVALVETDGDLGPLAEAQALSMGAEVAKVDASDPEALPMNAIGADSNEEAAQRAADAMGAVATDHPHYSNRNEDFARNFTVLARDYKASRGRDPNEATLLDVRAFARDFEDLKKAVGASIEKGDDGERVARIDAPWLSQDVANWLEQFYLPWSPRDRQHEVGGFLAYLNNLLSTEAARKSLCPQPGAEVLDLAHEVSEEAENATEPGERGRLIVLRFPKNVFRGNSADYAAYWALEIITEATIAARSEDSAPLALILDELAAIVGRRTRAALQRFQDYLVSVRKHNVAVAVAYQGWRLLPEILAGTLASNGANVLMSGGMRGADAKTAQDMLGTELRVETDERHDVGGGPGHGHRRSVGKRLVEKPRYSVEHIEWVPRGWWWLMRVHRGQTRKPVIVHVPMAKPPARRDEEPSEEPEGDRKGERPGGQPEPDTDATPAGGALAKPEKTASRGPSHPAPAVPPGSRRLPGTRDSGPPVRSMEEVLTRHERGDV